MPKVDKNKQNGDEAPTTVLVKIPEIEIRCLGSEKGPITAEEMKGVFGWMTEEEHKQIKLSEEPGVDISKVHFVTDKELDDAPEGTYPILLKSVSGEPVTCVYNSKNRPFDEQWSRRMAQELLERRWAGPTSWPGFTINGDTFKINEHKEVEDGQHRGIGLIIAYDIWSSDTPAGEKYRSANYWPPEKYPDGPVLETIVVRGITSSWRLTQTLDNTKSRSLADTIYTSEIFAKLNLAKKEEVSRMLAVAIDFLWIRLRLGGAGETKIYKTHVGSHEWLSRHKKLLKCVEYIFQLNSEPERDISTFLVKQPNGNKRRERTKLSPGACAAILFLQASSKSDAERYVEMEEPNESYLNWDMEDKAKEFWEGLAKSYHHAPDLFAQVRSAILAVNKGIDPDSDDMDPKEEVVAPGVERNIILQKAWDLFKTDQAMVYRDIMPAMSEVHNDDGEVIGSRLAELSNFGGIDVGDKYRLKLDDVAGDTSVEEAKEEASTKKFAKRERIAKGAEAKVSSGVKSMKTFYEQKERYKGYILLQHGKKKGEPVRAFMQDADVLKEVLGLEVHELSNTGGRFATIEKDQLNEAIKKLTTEGYPVAEIRTDAKNEEMVSCYKSRKKVAKPVPTDEEEE